MPEMLGLSLISRVSNSPSAWPWSLVGLCGVGEDEAYVSAGVN